MGDKNPKKMKKKKKAVEAPIVEEVVQAEPALVKKLKKQK